MGWCSGTEIFDEAIDAAIEAGVHSSRLYTFAKRLTSIMKDHDWDCEPDSKHFEQEGPVRKAIMDENEWDESDFAD